ncbi:hypothetical protein C9I43_09030 [Shewanella morhuae]|uniref:Uncharacterized protein n=1 Tax=Shewanella morhuae TaxID=365591 RepID=A0ABX5HVT8_9GAMM|nr:hypothetical protein C9I43_09030 [Shewanella morhuae]
MSQSLLRISSKQTGFADAKQVSHGDLRDDRPPHGRGGRASKDGLAASRRANAMASLCEWIPVNAKLLTTEITAPQTLLSNAFLSKSLLRISLKQTGFADAKQVNHGDLRDDRPPHGRSLASMPSRHL